MKIAIFLDVDKTITKNYIQEIYASELGMTEAYEKIEYDFQNKLIRFCRVRQSPDTNICKRWFLKNEGRRFIQQSGAKIGSGKAFCS